MDCVSATIQVEEEKSRYVVDKSDLSRILTFWESTLRF